MVKMIALFNSVNQKIKDMNEGKDLQGEGRITEMGSKRVEEKWKNTLLVT